MKVVCRIGFQPISAKYKEVNNNIKRSMKKAKENWIGEQCSEIEDNLRKNNSKRAYQPVKDLTTVKQRKASTIHDYSGNAAKQNEIFSTDGHNIALNCTITRPIEIHQYWAVPRQTQRMTNPSFAKKWRLAVQSLKKGK